MLWLQFNITPGVKSVHSLTKNGHQPFFFSSFFLHIMASFWTFADNTVPQSQMFSLIMAGHAVTRAKPWEPQSLDFPQTLHMIPPTL